MKPAEADRGKLLALLEELARSVEELLLSGLTTASESTRRLLEVSFQEASRMRLQRLAPMLRIASEQLGRFTTQAKDFSPRILCLVLNRAWLLSRGLARALRNGDEGAFARLAHTREGHPIERLEVVTLGVVRRETPGVRCLFEFRLRTLQAEGSFPAGARVSWSYVFPQTPGVNLPPEAQLRYRHKQGFASQVFLEGKVLVLTQVMLTLDDAGVGRIVLGENSTVAAGSAFTDWQRFGHPEPGTVLQRVRSHQPSPLDLEIELQEEIVLAEWQIGPPFEETEGQRIYPITHGPVTFHAVVKTNEGGRPLATALDALVQKTNLPPLFALLHYERCRLVLQPLALLTPAGPESLTLSREKLDNAALLKTIKF